MASSQALIPNLIGICASQIVIEEFLHFLQPQILEPGGKAGHWVCGRGIDFSYYLIISMRDGVLGFWGL